MNVKLLAAVVLSTLTFLSVAHKSEAHRDGCHRWHSCPSDTGSYVCGDMGYASQCPNSTPTRLPAAIPSRTVPPSESAYSRYMRIGYAASRGRDYQTALINFRRALSERPGDRYASEAANNMEALAGGHNMNSDQNSSFNWLSQRQVSAADLQGKSQFQLDVMRNAIYAMHGRRFDRSDLQNYFNQQPWYQPRYSPNNFPANLLTSLEQSNAQIILNYQSNR
jgi:hypothetical protein